MRSRRTAADDDQRDPLKERHIVVLLALKLRTASKHAFAISSGYATSRSDTAGTRDEVSFLVTAHLRKGS